MRSMVEGIYPTMLAGPRRTVARARKLRRAMTMPEVVLWNRLRLRPGGFKFRRQHPAGCYVLDFFCSEARLAIEIDGMAHDLGNRPEADAARDAWLARHDVATLRIAAAEVTRDADNIVEGIVAACRERLNPLHQPSARGCYAAGSALSPCPRHRDALRPPPRSGEEIG